MEIYSLSDRGPEFIHLESMKKQESFSGRKKQPSIRKANPKGRVSRPRIHVKIEEETIRLNKFIAASGICSRREADEFIKAGLITVNGNIVMELGTKVAAKDEVRYNGERIKSERLVYILLNKPKDFITTVKDPHAARTVLQLVAHACKERIYPVGRLDRNTTGVLLLTNDGDLAKTLTHPRYNKLKIYHVSLYKSLAAKDFQQIREGLTLEDGFIKVDEINYTDATDKSEIGIEIHSGRNRIVRRIFEHLGYRIKKLDRVYFAGLTKKGLTRGQWRFLTEREISMLKMGAYK
jgi:23S rRNA pseudouridine2605 synthase